MRFISYAQNFEDVMLWRAFGNIAHGFYIDVGAADPVDMSVTQAFYTAGWRGVNIEPATHYFDRLQASRPEDVNLFVAISDFAGRQMFHEIGDTGLSTLDAKVAFAHADAGLVIKQREIEVITLAEVCCLHAPGDIHFLKIDVEGAESKVLAGADFQKFRPWVVLLEATQPLTTIDSFDWEPMMLDAGYVFVWFDGLNRFYLARERYDELHSHFKLPPNSFDNFDKFDFRIESRFSGAHLEIIEATSRLHDNANEIKLLEAEVLLLRRMNGHAAQLIASKVSSLADLQSAVTSMEILNRLAMELQWERGPRALRLVLPLARKARGLMANKLFRNFARQGAPVARRLLRFARAKADKSVAVSLAPRAFANNQKVVPSTPGAENHPRPRRAVHQFHPGSATGDAVTNAMFLIQRILRNLGYRSEIYVEHRDPDLVGRLFLLEDLPLHNEYVLMLHHSLGYDRAEKIAALPAPKILIYHNITPAHLLGGIPALAALADVGRAQLDFWRSRVAAAIAISEFNAIELRRQGYQEVVVCPLLFDISRLRASAGPRKLRAPGDPFTILFVGRIIESKAQAQLVDAFGAFNLLYGQPCRLILVGRTDGGGDQYLADLYQRIGEQGLRRAVTITGHIPDDEVRAWYDCADLYVSLSQHEGFGVPLIEAMVHDVPVIAYAAGAVASTMQESGTSGAMLFTRQASVVAAAMLQVANNPRWKGELIAAQRRNLDRFALSRHIPVLTQVLAKAGAAIIPSDRSRHAADHLRFNVAGHFNGSYSLAAVNRSLALVLESCAPGRVRIEPAEGEATDDLSGVPLPERAAMQRLATVAAPSDGPSVTISQHYPLYVPPDKAGSDLLIAYFFWEESLIPKETVARLNSCFDAVFSPSQFVAKALIDSGVCLPVRTIGYAPPLEKFIGLGEARDRGQRPRNCVFLHVSSAFPRKGVDLLLAAYAASFTVADPVRLVIKTFPNPHNEIYAQVEKLRIANQDLPPIELIDCDLDEEDLLGLYADADVAVLPTRGEGFNIPAAEAIAAGLRLIVTGAGGHADFITDCETIYLPWQAEPSRSHLAAAQSLWLAPDQTALAIALRQAFDDFTCRKNTTPNAAALARDEMMLHLDRAAWGRRIAIATSELMSAQPTGGRRIAIVSSWNVPCGVAEYTKHLIKAVEACSSKNDTLIILSDDRAPVSAGDASGPRVRTGWTLSGGDTAERLACAISQEDPDIVMIQHQPGLIGWLQLASLLADRRVESAVVIVTLHTSRQILDLSAAHQHAVVASLHAVARVIVHTVADVNLLHRLGLWANVAMVAHGAPPAQGRPLLRPLNAASAPVIGCFGFLLPKKGLRELIAAIPRLSENWPGLRVKMVNALYPAEISGQEFEACCSIAEELQIADRIEWVTGFQQIDHANALLAACDLIVLPYQHSTESSSAALRSCLATGIPVAVTPLALFDEAEDAVFRLGGISPAAIAEGARQLLNNLEERVELQVAASGWLAERGWDSIGSRTYGMMMGLSVNRGGIKPAEVSEAECV